MISVMSIDRNGLKRKDHRIFGWRETYWGTALWTLVMLLSLGCHREPGKSARQDPQPVTYEIPILPRLQWQSDHGYCGEASLQSVGLYFGAWVSQGIIRKAAGGELLLGVNETKALRALHFTFEIWDSTSQGRPQVRPFLGWLKSHLKQQVPCITGIYLEGFPHAAYDHIVPVVGVVSARDDCGDFNPQDALIYHNLFSTRPCIRSFHSLGATREGCESGLAAGGNIPEQVAYGVAITGLKDTDGITLPLRLEVKTPSEPNWTRGENPSSMTGHVKVSGLKPGHRYILLRYDKITDLPVRGGALTYLRSAYTCRVAFQASDATWDYDDPRSIPSSGATYYRCIPAP